MWKKELDVLKDQYLEYKDQRDRLMNGEDSKKKHVVKKVVKKNLIIKE
jgi:hypothetical protein